MNKKKIPKNLKEFLFVIKLGFFIYVTLFKIISNEGRVLIVRTEKIFKLNN